VPWLICQKIAGLEYWVSCYSTLRRWVYAKCRPAIDLWWLEALILDPWWWRVTVIIY